MRLGSEAKQIQGHMSLLRGCRSGDVVATGNASYTELFNMGPGGLYFSGATGRVMVTQSQDGTTYLNPGTGAQRSRTAGFM